MNGKSKLLQEDAGKEARNIPKNRRIEPKYVITYNTKPRLFSTFAGMSFGTFVS